MAPSVTAWLHTQAGRARWMQLIIVLAWSWAALPPLAQSLLSPKRRAAVGTEDQVTSALATTLTTLLVLALLACCVVPVVLLLDDMMRRRTGVLVLLLLPWVFMVGRGLYLGDRPHRSQLVYPLIVLAVWALRPPLRSMATLGGLVGLTAAGSVVMGFLLPQRGIFHSAQGVTVVTEKQIFASGILTGPFGNGNTLAQFLVIGLPAVFLITSRWWRRLLVAAVVFALIWTASRSSLFALGMVGLTSMALTVTPPRLRGYVGSGVLAGLGGLIVLLPLETTDPTAFTNRGFIWRASLEAWSTDPWFGRGTYFYTRIASTSENLGSTVFHGHNQFVQLLVQGGLVLALLVAAVMIASASSAGRAARAGENFGLVFLAGLLGTCLLEVSFAMIDRPFLVPVMTIPLAVVALREHSADERAASGADLVSVSPSKTGLVKDPAVR